MTAVLVAAGVLLSWGSSFAQDNVRTQLAEQHIVFPSSDNAAVADPAVGPYLTKYAGQTMTTGPQARAYADHFIAVHLKAIGGGKTYAELSAQAQANPNDAALAATVSTMFRGETLRALLLNAYAFWQLGQIARVAAIGAFTAGILLLCLSILGMWHASRTSATKELFSGSRDVLPAVVD